MRWPFRTPATPGDDDIRREIADHLDLEAEDVARYGAGTGAEAAASAHRLFGNTTFIAEDVRAVWRPTWLEQFAQDLRHGVRSLRRSPAYTLTATITLALGIGASTAVFSLGDHVLARPFPQLPEDELVWVVQRSPHECPSCDNASPAALTALRERATTLSAVGAAQLWRASLNGHGDAPSDLVNGYRVTPNLFSLVAAPFALGRGFPRDAGTPGRDGVAIVSYDYWHTRFDGSRGLLDSTVMLDGAPRRVVGVLAKGIAFPEAVDVYTPLVLTAANTNDHASRYLDIFGRLAAGATVADAQREAARISLQMASESPTSDAGWVLVPRPLNAFHNDDTATLVRIFAVAVALVLVAACVSTANLSLARTSARRREMALRAALGGRRGRLARHLLTEALLVAFAGSALGVGFAAWGIHAASRIMPPSMTTYAPGLAFVRVDGRALAFTLVLCIAVTLLFALAPAVRATRVPLSAVLAGGGRGAAGDMHGTRVRAVLVIVEVSVAIILLSAAALLTRSARNMVNGDPGVRLDHVLTMQLSLPRGTADSGAREFVSQLDGRLRNTPGVLAAGVASTTPLSNNWWGTIFSVPGRPPQPNGNPLTANDQRISADYFRAMGIRIVNGRGIDAGDRADTNAQRVAVINHYMASHLWPNADPLGRTITIDSVPWTIVGVAADVHHGGLDEPLRNEIYRAAAQAPSTAMDLEVWTAGDPRAMREPIRLAVANVDPRAAVGQVMTMREMEARHISPFWLIADVVNTFAIIVVLIAVVGLYGMIAYGVSQRRRELAVRMALGASRRDIVSHVAGGAVRLTSIGVVMGVGGAVAFARLLAAVLYGVPAGDPATLVLVAALLITASVAAALIPCWRAARVHPAHSLTE